MTIVTTGNKFTDIDGLACVLAYEELLNKKGIEATHFLSDNFTESVPALVKDLGYKIKTEIPYIDNDTKFIVTDISEPKFFPEFIDIEKIEKIFDHHFGNEEFWKEKLGDNSVIREIGACATLIYQEWVKEGLLDSISPLSANLLITAIISNSLNFKASVTKDEDIQAYKDLLQYSNLPRNWTEKYFEAVTKGILIDPIASLKTDTKVIDFKEQQISIGQLEVWDGSSIIKDNLKDIINMLNNNSLKGFVTIANIGQGINYLICTDPNFQKLLKEKIGANFIYDFCTTDKLYLRKELIRILNS